MKEPRTVPRNGTKLRVTELITQTGLMVGEKYLKNRRADEEVTMAGIVPGHGGDVWWCRHENGDIAVYSWSELEYVSYATPDSPADFKELYSIPGIIRDFCWVINRLEGQSELIDSRVLDEVSRRRNKMVKQFDRWLSLRFRWSDLTPVIFRFEARRGFLAGGWDETWLDGSGHMADGNTLGFHTFCDEFQEWLKEKYPEEVKP